jgi:hypothetical protein
MSELLLDRNRNRDPAITTAIESTSMNRGQTARRIHTPVGQSEAAVWCVTIIVVVIIIAILRLRLRL